MIGNFSEIGTGELVDGAAVEEPAKTVGEVAMMLEENANLWPSLSVRKLANLQDRIPETHYEPTALLNR